MRFGIHAFVLHVHMCEPILADTGSPCAKVKIQLLHSDADSVYCIQVMPLDIMSTEIKLLPLIQ